MEDKRIEGIIATTKKDSKLGFLRATLYAVAGLCGVVGFLYIDSAKKLSAQNTRCDAEKAVLQKTIELKDVALEKSNNEKVLLLQKVADDYQKRADEQEAYNRQIMKEREKNNQIINTFKK